jgi:SAM-dependent methyltransferase
MYEDVLVTHLFRPLASRVLDIVPPTADQRILDVACGTGIVIREAASRVPGLLPAVGIDLNPMMLDVARSIGEQSGLQATWEKADVAHLPLEDELFDLAYCQQGLQFFPERTTALSEIRRVLKADARLVNITWQGIARHPFIADLNEISRKQTGEDTLAPPFLLGDRGQLEHEIGTAGFRDIDIQEITVSIHWDDPERYTRIMLMGATAAIPSMQKLTPEDRTRLVSQIISEAQPVFDAHSADGVLNMDWYANILVARKS